MTAIFDFQHARTYDSIPSSLYMLRDTGNLGVAVGISLLSCIWADIYVMSYLLPVNGHHLWFSSRPDIGQYFQLSICVAWPCKYGCCRWNFVAIMCMNWDLCNWIFKAAILEFWLTLTYLQLTVNAITSVECPHMNILCSQSEFRS